METVHDWLFAATLFAALGCGLMAGVFFAFSAFVMKALARLPSAEGIAAMQSINLVVMNPVFGVAFFGTAATCLLVLIFSLFQCRDPSASYLLVGSLLYLAGSLLVTMLFNVPKNEALALVTPAGPDSANLWASYLTSWTVWNHVRTAAAFAAAAALSIALCY